MLEWENAKFYSKKYFKTMIDLYYCQNSWISMVQPWKPWVSYIIIPKHSIVYFENILKTPNQPGWFDFSSPLQPFSVKAFGCFPPMIQNAIDLTVVLESCMNNPDILKLDRRLSYGASLEVISF